MKNQMEFQLIFSIKLYKQFQCIFLEWVRNLKKREQSYKKNNVFFSLSFEADGTANQARASSVTFLQDHKWLGILIFDLSIFGEGAMMFSRQFYCFQKKQAVEDRMPSPWI